jgi:hypothetical protein
MKATEADDDGLEGSITGLAAVKQRLQTRPPELASQETWRPTATGSKAIYNKHNKQNKY